MQELDYNPSKKDLTDAKIHHLLAEELKPYKRVCIYAIFCHEYDCGSRRVCLFLALQQQAHINIHSCPIIQTSTTPPPPDIHTIQKPMILRIYCITIIILYIECNYLYIPLQIRLINPPPPRKLRAFRSVPCVFANVRYARRTHVAVACEQSKNRLTQTRDIIITMIFVMWVWVCVCFCIRVRSCCSDIHKYGMDVHMQIQYFCNLYVILSMINVSLWVWVCFMNSRGPTIDV